MKKKTLGRLAAAGIAGLTAVSSMGISASALNLDTQTMTASGTIYKVVNSSGVSYYRDVPTFATSYSTVNIETELGAGRDIYVDNGRIYTYKVPAGTRYSVASTTTTTPTTPGVSSTFYVAYPYATNVVYLASDGNYYPNAASVRAAGYSVVSTKSPAVAYSSANCYFDPYNGNYSSYPVSDKYTYIRSYSTSYDTDYAYYGTYDVYEVNGIYYPTYSSALNAAGNDPGLMHKVADYSAPATNYFSKITGKYYTTYSAALSASRNSSENVVLMHYYNTEYTDDYYYYYDRYPYNYKYGDPYYYYWLQKYSDSNKNDNTTSNKDTTSATIGKRKGWTTIAKYLGSLKNGSSVSVDMNTETSVPSSVMSAFKGKNVTVKFVLDNGVVFSINGRNISSASTIGLNTAYNTKFIPSKLVKAAYKKNDAVSTAQITIDSNSFGAEADVTVKFASKRAGCSAKLYRYNSLNDKLVLVDSAKVQSNGKCTFGDVTSGGSFLIVLY